MNKQEKAEIIDFEGTKIDLENNKVIPKEEVQANTELELTKRFIEDDIETRQSMTISINEGNKQVVSKAINNSQTLIEVVNEVLKEGNDYGVIPGTKVKTLFQGGASVLARTFGIKVDYELVDKEVDKDDKFYQWTYKATAYAGNNKLGEATATANTREQKFYANFWDTKLDKPKLGKSVYDILNTVQQMSQKRAFVRVIRLVLGITSAFTQDYEPQATKEEQLGVYSYIYELERYLPIDIKWPSKAKIQEFLKKVVLGGICENLQIDKFFKNWTTSNVEDIKKEVDRMINARAIDSIYLEPIYEKMKGSA